MADKQKKLARHVTVGSVTYGPNDELPEDAADALADNPYVWMSDEEVAEAESAGTEAEPGTSHGARLATHVTVGGVTYGPNDPLPDDVAEQLAGNPHVWAEGKAPNKAKARAAAKEAESRQEKAKAEGDASLHDANAEAFDSATQDAEEAKGASEGEPEGSSAGAKSSRSSRSRAH